MVYYDISNRKNIKTPLLEGDDVCLKRDNLKSFFKSSFLGYEALFNCITDNNAYYLRPEPLRHPLIFYYGHTATFFINKLILGQYIDKRINEQFESMFAVGVDEMTWDDLDKNHYDWPTVQAVSEYRKQVCALVEDLIDTMPLELPISEISLAWIIVSFQ